VAMKFIMSVVSISLTPNFTFIYAGSKAYAAPAKQLAKQSNGRTNKVGISKFNAINVVTVAPSKNCPSKPRLKKPELREMVNPTTISTSDANFIISSDIL
jgi:DNA polymerase/3'-5' exonuclease PolX